MQRLGNIVARRDAGVCDDHQPICCRDEARHGLVLENAPGIDDDEIVVLAETIETGDEAAALLRF